MDEKEFKKQIEIFGGIYAYMFGSPWLNYGEYHKKDAIEFIEAKSLDISNSHDCICYAWGWPGPDVNIYYFSDYKKTWAFRKIDIEEPQIPKGCCSCKMCEYAPEQNGAFSVCLPKKCPRTHEILDRGGFFDNVDGYCNLGVVSEKAKAGLIFPIHEHRADEIYDIKLTKRDDKQIMR